MDQWFNRVESYLKSINLLDSADISSRLWNADEIGFCTGASSSLVLARKGSRTVHETCGGSGQEFYTVLAAGAADGTRLPPFLLYKGAHLYARWTKNGPAGALYGVSGSKWMEGANFKNWFEKLFVPAVSSLLSTGAVVLFVDGHHSHLTMELIQAARSHLFCLPPHTTHILQPLDVGVYGPVKKTWKSILKEHRLTTLAGHVTIEDFPGYI